MIIHSIRYLLLAKQIKENTEIKEFDFTCANSIYYEVMSMESTNWTDYDTKYRLILTLIVVFTYFRQLHHDLAVEVFPLALELDTQLDSDEESPLPIRELKRCLKYSGFYQF